MASQQSLDPIQILADLGQEYRRVREDHDREMPHGSTRRRLDKEMQQLAERFERLLDHWVQDQALRKDWQAFVYHGAAQPNEPRLAIPPLFRGLTQAGATLEIREASDHGYDIFVDGAHVEHQWVPWHLDPERIQPVQIGEWACREVFSAPEHAVAALLAFHAQSGASPPWHVAAALYEDGLIDSDFGLTPRGERRLRQAQEIPQAGVQPTFCVLLANAAHVRILNLASTASEHEPTLAQLEEVADMSNPKSRARDSDRFSDTRPGLRREGPHGPRHGVSDRRQNHRKKTEQQFADLAVAEAVQVWRESSISRPCTFIVVAGPQMLGMLRTAMARHVGSGLSPDKVVEFPRELTDLEAPAVHDALAKAGILPSRGRRPPILPMRTPNPWQEGK